MDSLVHTQGIFGGLSVIPVRPLGRVLSSAPLSKDRLRTIQRQALECPVSSGPGPCQLVECSVPIL